MDSELFSELRILLHKEQKHAEIYTAFKRFCGKLIQLNKWGAMMGPAPVGEVDVLTPILFRQFWPNALFQLLSISCHSWDLAASTFSPAPVGPWNMPLADCNWLMMANLFQKFCFSFLFFIVLVIKEAGTSKEPHGTYSSSGLNIVSVDKMRVRTI